MNTKSYTVNIFGQEYNLVSDEVEAEVVKAADLIHEIMSEISNKAPSMNNQKIAVLAALQLANQLLQIQKDLADRKQQEDALVVLINQRTASL